MIRIAKQHKDEPRPLKFAHLFKNATTIDEILKFLEKTEIVTRNWLQNQNRTEEEKIDEEIKKGKNRDIKGLHAIRTVTEPIVTLLIDGIRSMQNIHSLNQRQAVKTGVMATRR
jgi:CO dehydrogenase/acetyl-CoA synthase beta subunit